jgi:hypothetical protein
LTDRLRAPGFGVARRQAPFDTRLENRDSKPGEVPFGTVERRDAGVEPGKLFLDHLNDSLLPLLRGVGGNYDLG